MSDTDPRPIATLAELAEWQMRRTTETVSLADLSTISLEGGVLAKYVRQLRGLPRPLTLADLVKSEARSNNG